MSTESELREMLRNVIASNERERLEAAERDARAFADLKRRIEREQEYLGEREGDLLDVIKGTWEALVVALPFAEGQCGIDLRTIAARAEDALRQAGELL